MEDNLRNLKHHKYLKIEKLNIYHKTQWHNIEIDKNKTQIIYHRPKLIFINKIIETGHSLEIRPIETLPIFKINNSIILTIIQIATKRVLVKFMIMDPLLRAIVSNKNRKLAIV